jgi:hypothetical protein
LEGREGREGGRKVSKVIRTKTKLKEAGRYRQRRIEKKRRLREYGRVLIPSEDQRPP